MDTLTRKFKLILVACGCVLFSSFVLSGCFSTPNGEKTPTPASTIGGTFTPTMLPFTQPGQNTTETSSPTAHTATSAPSLTDAFTPTPTASLTSTPYPDGYVLFEADFETASGNLILDPGWEISEDESGNHFLCNFDQSKPSLQIGIGETYWKNYQLEFEVKQIEFASNAEEMLAILMRENDQALYHFLVYFVSIPNYPVSVPTGSGHVHFGKSLVSGEYVPLTTEYFEEPVENQWYRVRIGTNEGNISFYWNNKLVFEYHDEDYLPAGAIRIYTDDGTCLDNIRVTNIQNP